MSFEWLNSSNPVALWWFFLITVATLNILSWVFTFNFFKNKSWEANESYSKIRRYIVFLSALYVFGCAFRSFIPRADVQRICLFDTWFSCVFIGRFVATIAELSFVAQWALVLNQVSKTVKSPLVLGISLFIVPFIALAECFSWYAVITTHYLGNTCEESIWGITYALIAISLFVIWRKMKGLLRYAVGFTIFGCILYVIFMATVDVPMYFNRWQADTAAGKVLFGLKDGLIDLNTRWVVTHDISDWKQEIPWMSLYFSFAVWTSLILCYVPFGQKAQKYLK